MSFICPKCGTRDSACWHSSHWFLHTMTCKIQDLEIWEPKIAEQLRTLWIKNKQGGQFEESGYFYAISRFGRVYRVPIDLKDEYKRGHIQDKPKDKRQTVLEGATT